MRRTSALWLQHERRCGTNTHLRNDWLAHPHALTPTAELRLNFAYHMHTPVYTYTGLTYCKDDMPFICNSRRSRKCWCVPSFRGATTSFHTQNRLVNCPCQTNWAPTMASRHKPTKSHNKLVCRSRRRVYNKLVCRSRRRV